MKMDYPKNHSGFVDQPFEHPDDPPLQDNDIVISGMSSVMPGCENLKEWTEKLYNKENMVRSDNNRWKLAHPELSQFYGQIPGVDRFDAQFFMMNQKLSHTIDPGSRKLLEHTHQALFDAGVCPSELSRKRVGVFIALSQSETEKSISREYFGLVGCNRAMYANRISYWLNITGPSFSVDASCSGSVVALEQAYQSIMSGQCEAALVGAAMVLLHPQTLIHHGRSKSVLQNFDGKTKCYDINADGQFLSESVSVLYLQKYKNARRVYAQLRHVKTNYYAGSDDGFRTNFGRPRVCRDPEILTRFLTNFYKEAGVSPSCVEYVEGIGKADPDTDKSELQAIEAVFCKDRTGPLLLGSVASNIGFTEVVAGINGVIKIIQGYQNGVMAANINCENPRQDIAAIRDGRIKILKEHHPIRGTYAALNSFSITGIDGHVLLKGNYKNKKTRAVPDLPYLVTISSREENGVEKILNFIKSDVLDPEELGLLREIYKMRTPKHLARGFGVFASKDNETVSLSEKVDHYDEVKRPLWFVYSGMGSQWTGMGAQLMRIPIFSDAILRCEKVLKPKGINIVEIITSDDKKIFDDILNTFVGITAIQIALTDVLLAVGLTPDKIIGHSMGELGCAYADNCLTAEETILMAYYRGLVSVQVPFIKGSMAAVGMGYKKVSKLCPPEIEVACHNGPDSSTLSGPDDIMKKFVEELKERGIFAKEVDCSNIPYHSRYIAKAGPIFLKLGREVIKKPKFRSNRWLSTSVPKKEWKHYDSMVSSADYHANNLLKPVLFQETCRMIPDGAVLVEIAPHGLLQAILKRSLPSDCRNIPLTNRTHINGVVCLLEALGRLYIEGCDVDNRALYPKLEFPVSTKTRQLSHMVEHIHQDRWNICRYMSPDRRFASSFKPIVTLFDDEYQYLSGSVVEGIKVFPVAGILMFVWDTLAMSLGVKRKQISVEYKDLRFYDQPVLEDHHPLELTIMLQKQSGRFEVTQDPNNLIAEGYIETINSGPNNNFVEPDDEDLILSNEDVYKLLYERGYEYTADFKSIQRINLSLTKADIIWKDNWTTYVDGIFQMISLRHKHDGISDPSCVRRIIIDVEKHKESVTNNNVIEAAYDVIGNMTRCGGFSIENVILKEKSPKSNFDVGFKSLKFIPFAQEHNNVSTNLYVVMQIVTEQLGSNSIKVLTINDNPETDLLHRIKFLLSSKPEIKIETTNINETELTGNDIGKPDLVLVSNEIYNKQIYDILHRSLPADKFLLTYAVETKHIKRKLFKSIFVAGKREAKLELFKWVQLQIEESIVFPIKNALDLMRLQNLRKDLELKQTLTVVTTYPPIPGVKDAVKKLRAEDRYQIHLAMINSKKSELDLKKIHNLDMAVNIFEHGKWGGEYYVPLEEQQTKSYNVTLQIGVPGDLTSLKWVGIDQCNENEQGIPLRIHYAGLNTHDAKRVTSEILVPIKNYCIGMDFSGLNDRNEPIMGLIAEGAVCSNINFKSGLIWPVPGQWSLEEAATVPLPYSLAFYCLCIRLKLVRGMNILIHGGAGALGQAAISIAMAHGCVIFTTVSDNAKKRFLKELYPDLPENHIGNSRDDSFRDMILNLTMGQGCEIIISNVKKNLKNATLTCCANSGTTLDMTQIHDRENYEYGMFFMTKARSYCPVDFSSVFNNEDDLKRLQSMVSDGIARGYVRPLSHVTYAPHEISRAIRLLAASHHRGRVLLRLKDQQPLTQPRITCHPELSYLILSESDGLGLKLVDKLISCGAKKIQLYIQSSVPLITYKQKDWIKSGVDVKVASKMIDDSEIESSFEEANKNGPVDGVFILQNDAKFSVSTLLKLDNISRKLTPSLKYFVIVNGNNIAQQICQRRTHFGFSAASISILSKEFDQVLDVNYEFGWKKAADVIEKIAEAKESGVVVYAKHTEKNIIEELTKIPGVKITGSTDDRTTLEDVGIGEGQIQEFTNLLKNKLYIKITQEISFNTTFAQLKRIQIGGKNLNKESTGIAAYFSSIYPDELIANTDLILMPSLLSNSELRADELSIEHAHMFIIAGLEGHHKKFNKLCTRLKISTAVLQLGYDNKNETIQEMAQRFANVIIHKLKYKNHFYLMGCDYGVLVAMETATILENCGLNGTVFCLGGSSEEFRADIETRLDGISESNVQNELIHHLCSLSSANCLKDLELELLKLNNFDDKVEMCAIKLRGNTRFNTQYLSDVIKSANARIEFARNYKSDLPYLKAKVVLIRALPPMISTSPIYATYDIPGSLFNAADYLGTSAIINRHLELDVLEDYYDRNLCETYLINDESSFVKMALIDS